MEIRKQLESMVISMNKYLKDVVQGMDILILLRNCHPEYRAKYAYALMENGDLKKEEAREFVKIV